MTANGVITKIILVLEAINMDETFELMTYLFI